MPVTLGRGKASLETPGGNFGGSRQRLNPYLPGYSASYAVYGGAPATTLESKEVQRAPETPDKTGVFCYLVSEVVQWRPVESGGRPAFRQGHKVLALTERTEHIDAIRAAWAGQVPEPFVLHGRMSKKQRAALIAALDALSPDAPRILLATGKLVGEGFDHPPLDTLVLAMPVSWKGTLQQYAGRLHREHASKTDVRIIDFVDTGHPALLRMWDKRQRGYRAMGYRVATLGVVAKLVS